MNVFPYCKDIFWKKICYLTIFVFLCIYTLHASATSQQFRTRHHQSLGDKVFSEDVVAEIRFGKDVAARILGLEKLNQDHALTRYINLIGNTLTSHSSRNELDYHFAVIDSEQINAFSAPGGYVFITTAAINFAEDEAEVAAILAHEIAHISQKHIVKELNIRGSEKSNFSSLARILGASADTTRIALTQAVDKAIEVLFKTGFKMEEEYDADYVATLLLAETGYDPIALQRFLLKVHDHGIDQKESASKTHPTSEQRFSKIEALILTESLHTLHYPNLQHRFVENTQTNH